MGKNTNFYQVGQPFQILANICFKVGNSAYYRG